MEHIGKKVFLAVAQEPFERLGESGSINNFATLVPLLTLDGQILERSDFHFGLVFWMVRSHAITFADPGRLIAGRLEPVVNPGRLEYQLAPDSAEIVQPSDLVEILTVEQPDVRDPRDLVNVDPALVLDHPPTPLVLVEWRGDVYGPFRTEITSTDPDPSVWSVSLRTSRNDKTVFRIPVGDLSLPDKFGPHYFVRIVATITYEARDPTKNALTHDCIYRMMLGPAFRKLPSMGYSVVSVETDSELLLRYAKKFATRKDVQRLRDLLQSFDQVPDLATGLPSDAERQVFESIKRRAGTIEEELAALSRSLVSSGLIDEPIALAVELKAQEHITQQAATLSADIAAKVSSLQSDLQQLDRRRDSLTDELDAKRRQAERELERRHEEFEAERSGKEANIQKARQELDEQRASISKHLEAVIAKYKTAKDEIVNQFILLAPFLERAGLSANAAQPIREEPRQRGPRALAPLEFPAFVTELVDESKHLLPEMEFFERFERHVKDCGYTYRRIDLASFHLSAKCCDLTILGGISGTGKSTLPLLYAEALAGQAGQGRHLQVGVSPSWLDMRDLMGHVNSLEQRFEPSESGLYRHLILAQQEFNRKQSDSGIYIIVLDEMNLSHIEHYFSGFLHALEHQREIRIFDSTSVSSETTFGPYSALTIPRSVRFVGTVNFDETTKQVSMRVLDRTNMVRLRPIEQTALLPAVTDQRPSVAGQPVFLRHLREWRRTAPLDRDVATLWDRIHAQLVKLGSPITPRRSQAIRDFIASSPNELLSPFQAFDLQIAQRLLPQVRGLYRPGAMDALDEFEKLLAQHSYGFPEALAAIADLRQLEDGGFPSAHSGAL